MEKNRVIKIILFVIVLISAIILSFYFIKSIKESKKTPPQTAPKSALETPNPVTIAISKSNLTSDRRKLLEISKKISEDPTSSQQERDSAQLFYYKNLSDLTPSGLSEDRHKNFIDSYITLYNLYKNGSSPDIKAKALLSYSYLYTESCSTNAWLHEAFEIVDSETFKRIKQESESNNREMSSRILLDVLLKANSLLEDKSISINIAENKIRIANSLYSRNKITRNEYQDTLKGIVSSAPSMQAASSVLENSPFQLISMDRKIFSMYVRAANEGVRIEGVDIDQEFKRQLAKTIETRSTSREGAYTNENNLRYAYAGYLWNSTKDQNKIKEVLAPSFTKDNESNSAGWIYGLSVSENRDLYPYLKDLAKVYPELRDFLKRHGWKNV